MPLNPKAPVPWVSLLQRSDWCGLGCPTLIQISWQDHSTDLGKKLLWKLLEKHVMGLCNRGGWCLVSRPQAAGPAYAWEMCFFPGAMWDWDLVRWHSSWWHAIVSPLLSRHHHNMQTDWKLWLTPACWVWLVGCWRGRHAITAGEKERVSSAIPSLRAWDVAGLISDWWE